GLSLDYGELRALPSKDVVADIHCVTGWSRLGDRWTGVPIREILHRVKPKPEAKYVMAHCEYGYTTSVPLSVLDGEDNLLCYAWNGQDLTPDHGWPLRSEEHTSELQSRGHLVCRLLLEKKKKT